MALNRRLVLEGIGTYFLMLVIAVMTARGGSTLEASIAIGTVLLALVYSIGPHTWAHFNPGMSLAFWIRGTMPGREVVPYALVQCLGAVLAVFTQWFLVTPIELDPVIAVSVAEPASSEATGLSVGPLIIGELLFTFALVFTTLHVATTRLQAGNQYFGLVVATIVVAGILAMGPVASAVFNPAVQVGLWTMGLDGPWSGFLVIGSNLVGASLAALVFKGVHGTTQDPVE